MSPTSRPSPALGPATDVSDNSTPKRLRLGTRASALALWQANHVKDALSAHWGAEIEIELVEITTKGDQIVDRPLSQVGGRGLFVTGIEDRLLADEIDFAVHSMKDLPGHTPAGLELVATPRRADPRDALVGPPSSRLAKLAPGTRVGTSSLRRGALVRRINPGVEIVAIRGNVPTRVAKIEAGDCDVVLLAAAGLQRLGLDAEIAELLDPDAFCPAACQGILALEIRSGDRETAALLAPLEDPETAIQAAAERPAATWGRQSFTSEQFGQRESLTAGGVSPEASRACSRATARRVRSRRAPSIGTSVRRRVLP